MIQPPIDDAAINTVRIPNEPIGATASWRAAAAAAAGQCQDERGTPKPKRCTRTLNGGHRLYQWTDGRVYCGAHFDDRRLGRR